MKKIILLIIGCLSLNAFAGLQVQTDSSALAVASTNTYPLYGDVTGSFTNGTALTGSQFINCTAGSEAYFSVGGFFTNSTANSSNVVFRVAQSVDVANWTNNAFAVTLIIPGNTTNWVNGHFMTSYAFPVYGLRALENINAANVTAKSGTCYLKAFVRPGI